MNDKIQTTQVEISSYSEIQSLIGGDIQLRFNCEREYASGHITPNQKEEIVYRRKVSRPKKKCLDIAEEGSGKALHYPRRFSWASVELSRQPRELQTIKSYKTVSSHATNMQPIEQAKPRAENGVGCRVVGDLFEKCQRRNLLQNLLQYTVHQFRDRVRSTQ